MGWSPILITKLVLFSEVLSSAPLVYLQIFASTFISFRPEKGPMDEWSINFFGKLWLYRKSQRKKDSNLEIANVITFLTVKKPR